MLTNGYIAFGSTKVQAESIDAIVVPYPSVGGAEFSVEAQRLEERNANGAFIGQQIGAPIITMNLEWEKIDTAAWWSITGFLDGVGDVFWCRYFSHTSGQWETGEFVKRGDTFCNPVRVNKITGVPAYYAGAGFVMESVGG